MPIDMWIQIIAIFINFLDVAYVFEIYLDLNEVLLVPLVFM